MDRTPAKANSPSSRIEDYDLYTTIGKGSSGEVKLAKDMNSGHMLAIKIIDHAKTTKPDIEREIAIMKLLRHHPNIIRFEKEIETETHTYIVMEYAAQGDLFTYLAQKNNGWLKLCEEDARKLFQEIIFGVKHCHDNKIVHRDIKFENLLVDLHGKVKIADFGLSGVNNDQLTRCMGTFGYIGPEVLSQKPYGSEADIWSCGVILYTLLCGVMPFKDEDHIPYLIEDMENGKYNVPEYLSSHAKDLIQKMFTADQTKRITASDILVHPWFQPPPQPQYVPQNIMQQSPMVPYVPQYVPQYVPPPVWVPQNMMHQYVPHAWLNEGALFNDYYYDFSVRAAHFRMAFLHQD